MGSKRNFDRFLLLWAGELVSSVGGGLTSFGLGVYVFEQTGSAANMALITLLAFLPTLLLSVPAGVLADRYDRRLLMMLGDGCSAIGILLILVCMCRGGASFTEICIGVTISSVFSSLLEPSYRATVTDLLDAEEYSRASGMVSLAGSARYLISPVLAGAFLTVSDIRVLLVLDIGTFFLTVICTGVVRSGLAVKTAAEKEPFFSALRMGWQAVAEKRGVFLLILLASVMTCFMGAFQILAEPLILDFADSATLGIGETVCASGMLVSGLFLGARGIKKGYLKVLSVSLAVAGIASIASVTMEEMETCWEHVEHASEAICAGKMLQGRADYEELLKNESVQAWLWETGAGHIPVDIVKRIQKKRQKSRLYADYRLLSEREAFPGQHKSSEQYQKIVSSIQLAANVSKSDSDSFGSEFDKLYKTGKISVTLSGHTHKRSQSEGKNRYTADRFFGKHIRLKPGQDLTLETVFSLNYGICELPTLSETNNGAKQFRYQFLSSRFLKDNTTGKFALENSRKPYCTLNSI